MTKYKTPSEKEKLAVIYDKDIKESQRLINRLKGKNENEDIWKDIDEGVSKNININHSGKRD